MSESRRRRPFDLQPSDLTGATVLKDVAWDWDGRHASAVPLGHRKIEP